jgi:hypothetical protein
MSIEDIAEIKGKMSKVLPNFTIENDIREHAGIQAYSDCISFFVWNNKSANSQIRIETEINMTKTSDSIELGIKESIAELIVKLQSVIKSN